MDLRLSVLRREVMTPRRPSSSFGLIAVSTMAMVFAVSSSLLLFSAHRHQRHPSVPVHLSTPPSPMMHSGKQPGITRSSQADVFASRVPGHPPPPPPSASDPDT